MQKVKILTSTLPVLSTTGNQFQTELGEWLAANPNEEVTHLNVATSQQGWMLAIIYKTVSKK
jgi:hypothetical protein